MRKARRGSAAVARSVELECSRVMRLLAMLPLESARLVSRRSDCKPGHGQVMGRAHPPRRSSIQIIPTIQSTQTTPLTPNTYRRDSASRLLRSPHHHTCLHSTMPMSHPFYRGNDSCCSHLLWAWAELDRARGLHPRLAVNVDWNRRGQAHAHVTKLQKPPTSMPWYALRCHPSTQSLWET